MRTLRITPVSIMFLALPFPGVAGNFGKVSRNVAAINVARPPEALLRGTSIAIKSAPGTGYDDPRGLEQAIERALSATYTPSSSSPDMIMTVAVTSYERIVPKQYNQTEKRNVKVGTKTVKNIITGKPMQVDDFQIRDVAVTYWEARGSLAVKVTVKNAEGVALDDFSPRGEYSKKMEIAENRVPKARDPIPTAQELQAGLQQRIASEIQRRYVRTKEPLEVRLAMDDELHPGNASAMAGRWPDALAKWTAAPSNSKIAADRLYNIGVAHEALAYASYDSSGNPEMAEASFQQAIKNYLEASKLDPGEKFFREAKERCERIRANYARAKEQWDALQRQAAVLEIKEKAKQEAEESRKAEEEARKQREAEQIEKDKIELTSTRPDSPDEAEFRSMARIKFRSQSGKPSAQYVSQLEENGQRTYKLSPVASKRVVTQELARLDRLHEYRDTFQELIARDKTIDAGERDSLKKFAARFALTSAEVDSIESEFQFKDLTAPQTASTKETKPAAPKPTAPKPTTRPAKPAAPKPSIPAQPDSSIKK